LPPAPTLIPRQTVRTGSLPGAYAAPDTLPLAAPVPAKPAGPASHWASAVRPRAAQRLRAPCSPAAARLGRGAEPPPRPLFRWRAPQSPPVPPPPPLLPAHSPPPGPPPAALPVPPQSHPARYESRES